MTPQHVQNLVIRDYATRHDLPFLLSATEYAMPGCHVMLDTAIRRLGEVDGIIFFSLFMMPPDTSKRHAIYARALGLGRTLHFALEDLAFSSERDIDRLEDMFRVDHLAKEELTSREMDAEAACPICGAPPVAEYSLGFSGVTSDVKPWPRLTDVLVCSSCGLVHKRKTPQWFEDVGLIYADYEAYHQGGGVEQSVRHESQSALSPRSSLLVELLKSSHELPAHGRVLDVGCGNGAFLQSFSSEFPDWKLIGVDRSEGGAEAVRGVAGPDGFVRGGPRDAPGLFDVISLVHVLEHVTDPNAFLGEVASKLRRGGVVLVDAPSLRSNPFDLVVVDHAMHFTEDTLTELARRVGFRVAAYESTLIRKEHVALLVPGDAPPRTSVALGSEAAVHSSIALLEGLAKWLPQRFRSERIGLLGTGIAAVWAFDQLPDGAVCFVDEDPNRQGQELCGVPVLSPDRVPDGLTVFIAQPPDVARDIVMRLDERFPGVQWLACTSIDEWQT